MTNAEKAAAYYKSAVLQRTQSHMPEHVPSVVRLDKQVLGDFPVGHATFAGPGQFTCKCNKYGAVSILADNGKWLGLRLDEFEPVEWVENEHAAVGV